MEKSGYRFRTANRSRQRALLTTVVLAAGFMLAACSSSSTSSNTTASATSNSATTASTARTGASSSLSSVVRGITKSSNAVYSVTYNISQASTGKSETVTFAQSPPKEAVTTSSGSFYIDGSTITECQGAGGSATCTSLPSSMTGPLNGLTALFSPGVLTNTLQGIEAQSAAHAAGVSVTTGTGTYGGLASTCITFKTASAPTAVSYCAADSAGILTYFSAGGSTGTLTAYSPNPPDSTFSPPAGATVQTLPAGTP